MNELQQLGLELLYLGGGGDEILLGGLPSTGVCLPLPPIKFSGIGCWPSEPLDCADRLLGGSFPMNEIRRLSDRRLTELSVEREEPASLVGRLIVGVMGSGNVVGDVILENAGGAYV